MLLVILSPPPQIKEVAKSIPGITTGSYANYAEVGFNAYGEGAEALKVIKSKYDPAEVFPPVIFA